MRTMRAQLFVVCFLLLVAAPVHAAEPSKIEEGWIKTRDGNRLYYQKIGNGPQKVVFPLRAFTIGGLKELADAKRTLVFYDVRNRGKSERVTDLKLISLEKDVEDLEAVREHFKFSKMVPAGYSYTGMMVMLYATKHPERIERIIQFGPVPPTFGTDYSPEMKNSSDMSWRDEDAFKALQELEKEKFEEKDPKTFCERVQAVLGKRDVYKRTTDRKAGNICEMENEWLKNLRPHMQAHFVGSVQKFVFPTEGLAKVTQPVLTVHGVKDRNAPYGAGREWAAILPNARLLSVPEAAHATWADQPEMVLKALDTFLKGNWPAKAERVTENPAIRKSGG